MSMARSRVGSLVLGGFLLLCCGAGGANGKVEVSMPEVLEVEYGETARIPCTFTIPGGGDYTYINWSYMDKNNRTKIYYQSQDKGIVEKTEYEGRVELVNDSTLAISKVTLQDARTFVCQVGASSSGVGENRTELHIYKAPETPVIQLIKEDIPVTSNEIPEIAECISRNGFPTPSITWYKNQSPLQDDDQRVKIRDTITRESSGLITLTSKLSARVTKEDRGAPFSCEASYNLLGVNKTAESGVININVFYASEKVKLSMVEPSHPVKEGDRVTLRCEADGNPPPDDYTFYKVMGRKNGTEEETELPPVPNGLLHWEKVRKEDGGLYRCAVFELEIGEELTDRMELTVNYLEGLKITPERPAPLQQGENLTLRCHAKASQNMMFQWKKKGKHLATGKGLNLTNVGYETSGNYTCSVSVPGVPGLSRSRHVSVIVQTPPQMIPKPTMVHVRKHELVNLSCEAAALPQPNITWSVANSTNHQQKGTEPDRVISNLTVRVTQELLKSRVTCTAANELGTAEHHFTLELRTTNSTPDAARTTNSTPDAAEQKPQESKGVIIVAVIVCILLIALLGAVLYFLHKKGKLPCGRTGKQEITRPDACKDEVVVEVKSDKLPEEAGLLQGTNGEKRPAGDQGEKYIDLRN